MDLILTEVVTRLARIVLILVLGLAAQRLIRRLSPLLIQTALQHEQAESSEELSKREETLTHVVQWSANGTLLFVVGLTILGELEVNVAPALASVGVIGIALGFGAQTLVRDVITGAFILLENQYRTGDVVNIAGIGGLVEQINLRRTILRDLDGIVHSIPNGEVRVASNYTKEWSRINLNISVAYGTDVDLAREVINRVGQEMAADPEFGPLIVGAPRLLRVDALEDSGVALKVLGETKPIRQWDVAGEFRQRILKAFAEAGIEIPFPHRVVISRTDAPPQAPPSQPRAELRSEVLSATKDVSERLPEESEG